MWTAFEYMYRDAGNFKAFGTVALAGDLDAGDQALIRGRLSSGEFFIAEQVGVPPLYRELYKWSGGPTSDDHCWHELVGFRPMSGPAEGVQVVSAREFVARFASVEDWTGELSPHFSIA